MSCSDTLTPTDVPCETFDMAMYANNRRCDISITIKNIAFFKSTSVVTKKKTGFDFDANRSQWKFRSRR